VRWEGEPLAGEPAVLLTGHIGALQALRYVLRARGVRAATVIGPLNLERAAAARLDAHFDRRHPLDFPHALPGAGVHRLRSALRRGSLIVAADLPEGPFCEAPFLGGTLRVDTRPLRLARVAGAACRPVFLTLPDGEWVLTVGDPLPADKAAAAARFARLFDRVARRAPQDLDGKVYAALAGRTP
jgi:lauroyl/myristoyl acyltransferase